MSHYLKIFSGILPPVALFGDKLFTRSFTNSLQNWLEGEFAGDLIVMFYVLNTGMELEADHNFINTVIDLIR